MAIELKIEIAGLTAVVPNYSNSENTDIESYLIAFPDINQGLKEGEFELLPTSVMPHKNVIQIPTELIKYELPGRRVKTDRKGYSAFCIENEHLSLEDLDEEQPLDSRHGSVDPNNPDTEIPANNREMQDLKWVAKLSLANTNHGNRCVGEFDRRQFINKDFTPKLNDGLKLGSIVNINNGQLFVESVISNLLGLPAGNPEDALRVLFAPYKRGGEMLWQQALYTKLMWLPKLKPNAETLTLSVKKESGVREPLVVLDLEKERRTEEIQLFFQNLESEPVKWTQWDTDFAVLYLYSKELPFGEGASLPIPYADIGDFGGGLTCRAAMFN